MEFRGKSLSNATIKKVEPENKNDARNGSYCCCFLWWDCTRCLPSSGGNNSQINWFVSSFSLSFIFLLATLNHNIHFVAAHLSLSAVPNEIKINGNEWNGNNMNNVFVSIFLVHISQWAKHSSSARWIDDPRSETERMIVDACVCARCDLNWSTQSCTAMVADSVQLHLEFVNNTNSNK